MGFIWHHPFTISGLRLDLIVKKPALLLKPQIIVLYSLLMPDSQGKSNRYIEFYSSGIAFGGEI
jgi:hypothetical protein